MNLDFDILSQLGLISGNILDSLNLDMWVHKDVECTCLRAASHRSSKRDRPRSCSQTILMLLREVPFSSDIRLCMMDIDPLARGWSERRLTMGLWAGSFGKQAIRD